MNMCLLGFNKVQGLDEYTNLTTLWLEGNGITEIQGLDKLEKLLMLYAHQN